jgi:hypothetical protein
MKKVRLALGVVGAIGMTPGLGMLTPTASAATAGGHPALAHETPGTGVTWTNCTPTGHSRTAQSSNFQVTWTASPVSYTGKIKFDGNGCVTSQKLHIFSGRTGLTERTRFRSVNNAIIRSTWQAGKMNSIGTETTFSSFPRMQAHLVCEALVANNNHNNVEAPPVCETT